MLQKLICTTGFAAALLVVTMPAHATQVDVDQKDLLFVPSAVTITAGDTIRFRDTDRIAHNITVVHPDGTAEDKGMDQYNENIVAKFGKPGVYHVRCRIHPNMLMTVTVKPAP